MKCFGEPTETGGARAAYGFGACPLMAAATVYVNGEVARSRPRCIPTSWSGRGCGDELRLIVVASFRRFRISQASPCQTACSSPP